jgi:anaerobic selenocysteine-containing dehydrogenase
MKITIAIAAPPPAISSSLLLAAEDLRARKWQVGQRVTVRSPTGTMRNLRLVEGRIRAGIVAMYYPEANILVPRATDPDSGTPAFKSVAVTICVE